MLTLFEERGFVLRCKLSTFVAIHKMAMRIFLSTLFLVGFSTLLSGQTPDSVAVTKDTIRHSIDTVAVKG